MGNVKDFFFPEEHFVDRPVDLDVANQLVSVPGLASLVNEVMNELEQCLVASRSLVAQPLHTSREGVRLPSFTLSGEACPALKAQAVAVFRAIGHTLETSPSGLVAFHIGRDICNNGLN